MKLTMNIRIQNVTSKKKKLFYCLLIVDMYILETHIKKKKNLVLLFHASLKLFLWCFELFIAFDFSKQDTIHGEY